MFLHLMNNMKYSFSAFGLLAILLTAGCANYEAYQPKSPDNLGDGPGLFTGEEGRYVIEFD